MSSSELPGGWQEFGPEERERLDRLFPGRLQDLVVRSEARSRCKSKRRRSNSRGSSSSNSSSKKKSEIRNVHCFPFPIGVANLSFSGGLLTVWPYLGVCCPCWTLSSSCRCWGTDRCRCRCSCRCWGSDRLGRKQSQMFSDWQGWILILNCILDFRIPPPR